MIEIEGLSVSFSRYKGWFSRWIYHPIQCIDLSVHAGEIVALVGESGSGKSLVASAILGLLPKNAIVRGGIRFEKKLLSREDIIEMRGKEFAWIPPSISFLSPLIRVGCQAERAGALSGKSKDISVRAADRAFLRLGLPHDVKKKYPFELSGGMARRVMTAVASIQKARLIIADEPTKGLDPDRLDKFLFQLKDMANEGAAVILITHDLSAALEVADKIAVVKDGITMEIFSISPGFSSKRLRHPYSRELFASLPQNGFIDAVNGKKGNTVQGEGCIFSMECPDPKEMCAMVPPPVKIQKDSWVRCHNA